MLTAQEWLASLREAIREYTRTRRRTPAVRVWLVSGEHFYVHNAIHTQGLIAFSPYQEEREAGMVGADDEDNVGGFTPRLLLVEPVRVEKVELLYDAPPAQQALGFGIRPEE